MNSQAPVIMSAEEAWPRRPPGGRTRADRSPTMNLDASSSGGDSALGSPALGGSSANSPRVPAGFGPRLALPGARDSSEERGSPAVYRHEGTRLDKHKVARIAMAFGMAISAPAAAALPSPSHPASVSATSLQPPSQPPTSASTRHSRGNSSVASSSSSFSSVPPPSPFSVGPSGPQSQHQHALTPPPLSSRSAPDHLVSIHPPPYVSSSPVLLPLLPSLKAQLAAVAREFGLPSTVGLVMFLVYDAEDNAAGRRAGEGRVGEGVWEILWKDFLLAGSPSAPVSSAVRSAQSEDGAPLDFGLSLSAPSQPRSRVSSEPPSAPPSSPFSVPSSLRYASSSPRPVDPSESLLSRRPSTLTPASLRARKKIVRPSLPGALSESPSTIPGGSKTPVPAKRMSKVLSARSSRAARSSPTRTQASSVPPSSSATSISASPTVSRVRRITHRVPLSPFPFPISSDPSSPASLRPTSACQPSLLGGAISIVGTLEWDVDERGLAQWFDRWLSRKNLVREPRPAGGWQAQALAAAAASQPAAREVDSESEDDQLPADEGYARLSEDEADDMLPSSETGVRSLGRSDEGTTEGTSAEDYGDDERDSGLPIKGDPLGDMFPSDEADFDAMRSGRDQQRSPPPDATEQRPPTPPRSQGRDREGSIGLGLGIGLDFGLGAVEDRKERDLNGLTLTGAGLAAGGQGSDGDDAPESERGIEEISELLAQHSSLKPPLPAVIEPDADMSLPSVSQAGAAQLPPTPLKQRRKSSVLDTSMSASTARNSTAGGPSNPLNLTLEIASPPPSTNLPMLVTSPTSAFSPTGSDATGGGLAYLRGSDSMDSYASSGPSDSMLSAAVDGAFGHGGAGKRGSALMMQDTLADLEKVVRSLSPRELKIPNRERSAPYSPGSASLSPAPSGSSFAVFPSPAFPPSAFVSPAGSPSIVTTGSSPRAPGPADSVVGPSSSLRPQGPSLGKEERDQAVRSIASSFMEQDEDDGEDKKQPLTINTGDFAPPVWPAVPVSPGSPLLSDIPLPVRKDSPLSSPRVPSPVPSKLDIRQRMSSASSIHSSHGLGSPLSPHVGATSPSANTFPFPPPPTASPLQSAFHGAGERDDDEQQRTERSESVSTVNSKGGSRFRNFVWGRAASSGSLEDNGMSSPTVVTGAHGGPPSAALSPAASQGAFPPSVKTRPYESAAAPAGPVVPRHQSIPESRGPPPSRLSATPSGRSVSDSSALEVVSQFGKFQLTPEMPSTGFQEMNFPSPPTGSADRKSSSGGKKRFRAPFNAGSLFGKNKKQLEISAPEIGEPVRQGAAHAATVPFHHRQRSDPSDRPLTPRMPPTSPRKVSEGAASTATKLPPSISQSFSARSISSTLNGTAMMSPPGSPTSAMSPRSVKRKPVPGSAMGPHKDMQRSFSQESSLSTGLSIPDVEPPLPIRTTSLATSAAGTTNSP